MTWVAWEPGWRDMNMHPVAASQATRHRGATIQHKYKHKHKYKYKHKHKYRCTKTSAGIVSTNNSRGSWWSRMIYFNTAASSALRLKVGSIE